MIAKTSCQHCGIHIEFEVENANQFVPCPSCGKQTRLLMAGSATIPGFVPRNSPWAAPASISQKPAGRKKIVWVVTISLVLLAVVIYASFRYREIMVQIGGASVSLVLTVFLAIVSLLGVALAVLWIVFPWFVYAKLDRMIALLEKIEENTRQ